MLSLKASFLSPAASNSQKYTCVQIIAALQGWVLLTMIMHETLTAAPNRANFILNGSCSPSRSALVSSSPKILASA